MMRIQSLIFFSILCIIFVQADSVNLTLPETPLRPNDTDVSRYASYSYSQTYDDLVPGNMTTEEILYTSLIITLYITLLLIFLFLAFKNHGKKKNKDREQNI